ncbi:hypothetical protein [Gimesia fumaroli]|uniref:Uncharacterized protein n=1 Tax=Gimesia fumaroli TaxID=2527976 RepID=A0A518IFX0_9PLAN|nr:hypothetical protein [Gimesia fumaroli]QDV51986.1 hypothetical protein Enr17x_40450 [Gimesia fumaroli]
MSKLQLPLMSLVAAIPGGLLTYLLVMAFLNHAEAMSTTLLGVAGLTLLLSGFLTILPVGALIFGPKGASKKKSKSKDEPELEADEEDEDDFVSDSAAELSDEFAEDEFEEDDDMLASGDDLDFGEVDELSDSEISGEIEEEEFDFSDEYEFDDEDEEDK